MRHKRRQHLQNTVDVRFGRQGTEGKAQSAECKLRRDADRREHMARLQRAGGAGGTRGGADALVIQHQKKRFPLNSLKANGNNPREPLAAAVELHMRNLGDSAAELFSQSRKPLAFRLLLRRRAGKRL